MIAEEMKFNDIDAYTEYGVILTANGLSALKAPRTPKEPIRSESRLEHGARVIIPEGGQLWQSREFSMEIQIHAPTREAYELRFEALEAALNAGWVNITLAQKPGTIYKCRFISATTFSEYRGRAAKVALKFEEPNPGNRS